MYRYTVLAIRISTISERRHAQYLLSFYFLAVQFNNICFNNICTLCHLTILLRIVSAGTETLTLYNIQHNNGDCLAY